jgi:hypothetical protein
MQRFCLLLSLAVVPSLVAPTPAAAVDIEDIDSDSSSKKKKKQDAVISSAEIIREIERGWYFKAGAGVADYLDRFGRTLDLGSVVAVTVGNDFVDEPNRSMSYEFTFQQGVHNGMPFAEQPFRNVPPNSNIQGDTRTFSLLAAYRFAAYPGRRVGVGFQVGGGIMFAPLLIEKGEFETRVVQAWGGNRPRVHEQPHFPVFGGPTFEYYTKLSHFSIGVDTDITYAFGFDLGFNARGYMKYTF